MCCISAVQLGVQALQYKAAHTTKLDDAPPVMHAHSMKCPVPLPWAFCAMYVTVTSECTSCLQCNVKL